MEIDQHLVWLLGAIKACVSDNDVDEKKLNKNISDCTARVKSACSNGSKDESLEDFRLKSTLVLLLCCPAVRSIPAVQCSKDFQSVFVTFPVLKESVFYSVVRNQKSFKFLYPLLSCLPPSTLGKLMQEYFTCTNEVTPVTLAMTLELVKSLVSSRQNAPTDYDCEKEGSEIFELVLKFYSLKKVVGGSSAQMKSSAYFFMYLCECIYLVMCNFLGKYSEQLVMYQACQAWTDLWKVESEQVVGKNIHINVDILKSFLQICGENIQAISVDLWMEWSEAILPTSVTVHRKSVTSQMKPQQTSIQSIICNIAFDTLRIVELNSDLKDLLYECKDLVLFFKQIAADPEYDPDQDLEREQLLSEINLKDERQEKLLGILLKRDDIFASEECVDCVIVHMEVLDVAIRLQVLVRLMRHMRAEKDHSRKSVEMVLKMAEDIPAHELLAVIENDLASGQDEMLKMPAFHQQMTAVFNQLAEGNSCKNSTKHVWLCLQSGQSVVNEAVRLPIAFPGLVNVMVQALTAIPQVCQAPGKSGVPVIVKVLQERQLAGLQGREEKDFGDLVKGLIKAHILNAVDVLHFLVQPFLKFSSQKDLIHLSLPIDLLKCVIRHDIQAIVKPGAELVSLILTLAHVVNMTAVFKIQTVSLNLKLRTDALVVLRSFTQTMICDRENYERDISMLKQTMVKYKMHPRSFLPLKELLDCNDQVDTHVDCLLLMISTMQFEQWEGKPVRMNNVMEIPKMLSQVSREEWIMTLLQLLPHCSEEEWIIAFYITHKYLQCGRMALHTMMIFQRVLYLANMQVKGLDDRDGDLDKNESSLTLICLEHCFKCFSNASMVYLEELMKVHPCNKRFASLCSIFRWWCHVRPLFPEEQEVPSLFLMQLVSAMEEMLNSKKLLLVPDKELQDTPQLNVKSKNCKAKKEHEGHSVINEAAQEEGKQVNGFDGSNARSDSAETGPSDDFVNGGIELLTDQQKVVHDTSERLGTLAINGIHHSHVVPESDYNEGNVHKNCSIIPKSRTIASDKISKTEFKKHIEQVSVNFLKFFPSSNLTSSVAGKLKKLHEVS